MAEKSENELGVSWRNYVAQSLFAGFSILLAMNLPVVSHTPGMGEAIIIASLGSTAFVVFSLPSRVVASMKNCLLGHTWGIAIGVFFFWITSMAPTGHTFAHAAAVTVAFFCMVVTRTDHPPAAGTALGVSLNGISVEGAIWVLAAVAVISGSKTPLRGFLRDLR